MAPAFRSFPVMWEAQTELWAPNFGLVQPYVLKLLACELVDGKLCLSFSLPSSLLNKMNDFLKLIK